MKKYKRNSQNKIQENKPDRRVKNNTVRMEDVWNDEDSSENSTDEEVFKEQEKQVIFMPFRQANELQNKVLYNNNNNIIIYNICIAPYNTIL